MLKIDHRPTFTRTVTLVLPEGDGVAEQDFKATFRVLPQDELERFDVATAAGTRDFVEAVVASLSDIVDAAGDPVAWSPALRERVLLIPGAGRAIYNAYADALGEAIRKN